MTKPIILVKICYKLLYDIQGVENKVTNFLASADIRVFGRTCLLTMLLLIGLALFTPQVFLFSISYNMGNRDWPDIYPRPRACGPRAQIYIYISVTVIVYT